MVVRRRNNLDLVPFESRQYSQYGEAGVIDELLRRVPHERYVIEVGAWDGIHLSNTRHLIERGYAGLLVEADPKRAAKAALNADAFPNVEVRLEFVNPRTRPLSAILDEVHAPQHPALLSIDIDSTDYLVMESIGSRRPTVMVVEFNPTIPNHIHYVQREEGVRIGNSARAIAELGSELGYALVHAIGVNLVFMLAEQAETAQARGYTLDEALDDSKTIRAVWTAYNGQPMIEGGPNLAFPWSPTKSRPLDLGGPEPTPYADRPKPDAATGGRAPS